jgi:hypothetical protein
MVVAGLEHRLHLVERGQIARAVPGLVEIGRERLADIGQDPALVIDDAEELLAPVGGRVGIFG